MKENQDVSNDSIPKLIFVNFKISKDTLQDHSSVNISQVQFTDGSLKKETLTGIYKPSYQDEIRCIFTDNNEKAIFEIILEHPLYKKFEYAKDDGSFDVKEVTLKESVFSVRADYNSKMKYIRIFEKLSASKETEIAKLEIQK
jgi:hypothetical protein